MKITRMQAEPEYTLKVSYGEAIVLLAAMGSIGGIGAVRELTIGMYTKLYGELKAHWSICEKLITGNVVVNTEHERLLEFANREEARTDP